MVYAHQPVMLKEVLHYLQAQAGQKFIDGTLGGAGYTLALAQAVGSTGQILALDLDELAIQNAQAEIKKNKLNNIVLVRSNFKNIKRVVTDNFPPQTKFAGLVLDLGLSSAQLNDESRGFSFQGRRPLKMSFGAGGERSTIEIVNKYSFSELARVFQEAGERNWSEALAQEIIIARKSKVLQTTADLVQIIKQVIPQNSNVKINSATKVFQALRLETNQELEALAEVLLASLEVLELGGRLVIVSFHSGEDRLVKHFFKDNRNLQIITKKPISPGAAEVNINPRARSAKLRAAVRC